MILNLEETEKSTARRIRGFSSGAPFLPLTAPQRISGLDLFVYSGPILVAIPLRADFKESDREQETVQNGRYFRSERER